MSGSIWFKAQYVDPILARRKRSTMRATTRLNVGQVVSASVGPRPPFARIRVTAVEWIAIAALTDAHARTNGARTREELVSGLRRIYPGIRKVVVIRFRLID